MPDVASASHARRRSAPLSQTREKLFYSISEAATQLDVAAHVLRYWETQFSMLRPRKSRAGSRMYQPRDLDTLRTIKRLLYDEGMTIAGARRKLLAARRGGAPEIAEGAEIAAVPAAVAAPVETAPVRKAPAPAPRGYGAVADADQASLPFAAGPAASGLPAEVRAVRESLRELAHALRAPRARRGPQ